MTIDVAWHEVDLGAHDALAAHLRERLGVGTVRTGRLCSRCASSAHGRPWAQHDSREVPVSLSRAAPHLVTVMGDGPVGVDVESIAEVARRWQPELVLAPGERAEDAFEQARMWAAKEAVLKAYGVGLDRPMTSVRLDDLVEAWWQPIDAPEGYVAAVAGLR